MTFFEKRAALMARIDTLERHAAALQATFHGDEFKTQAADLVARLRSARARLQGDPPGTVLDEIEPAVDAASLMMASLGRLK